MQGLLYILDGMGVRNKMKRAASLILSALMICSLFSSCSLIPPNISRAPDSSTGQSGNPRPETESTTQAVSHTLEAIQEALEQSMRNGTAKPLLAHCLPLCEELLVFGEGREKISESEKRELRQAIQEATITYFFYDLPSAAALNDGIFIQYYGYTSQRDQTNGPFDYSLIKEMIEAFYAEQGRDIHILDIGFMEFDVSTDDSEDADHLTDALLGIVETDKGYFIFEMNSM